MISKIKELSDLYFTEIVKIRRHLHKHPELSFYETETSKYIKDVLNQWEIPFFEGIANNGIVVNLEGKDPLTSIIALRADFDALPIEEKNEVSYHIRIGDFFTGSVDRLVFVQDDDADKEGGDSIISNLRSGYSIIINHISCDCYLRYHSTRCC